MVPEGISAKRATQTLGVNLVKTSIAKFITALAASLVILLVLLCAHLASFLTLIFQ